MSMPVVGLTTREAFARLGVSRRTGYRMIGRGELVARRVGKRRLLIPSWALDTFLAPPPTAAPTDAEVR